MFLLIRPPVSSAEDFAWACVFYGALFLVLAIALMFVRLFTYRRPVRYDRVTNLSTALKYKSSRETIKSRIERLDQDE